MSFGILNNIPALQAEAALSTTQMDPQHHSAAVGHRSAHQFRLG